MNIVMTAGVLNNRKLILEYNKFVPMFANTFDMRHTYVKGGWMRLSQDTESALVWVKIVDKNLLLEVNTKEGVQLSKAFTGRIYCLLGAFIEHAKNRFKGTDVTILNRSDIPDMPTLTKWGEWAYKQMVKNYPNLNR